MDHPHRSKRLVYTIYEADKHDNFLWGMHTDAVSWTLACPQIQRPTSRGFHEGIIKHKLNLLLFVIINKEVIVNDDDDATTSQTSPKTKLVPIGQVGLTAADVTMAQHRATELSIGIHKDYQGQGYGTEAIGWAIDWAFNYANMHRVSLEVFAWNEGAHHMYKKAGFREEGRQREALFKHGKFWDIIMMSILVHEWRDIRGLDAGSA
ncbi:hypothetical protein NQ176_g3286 [Zarea fungicola]|uniref:Uncharacterized protein n=1 Tax=Zarea fungicola TaxID=93591 RepID=A0ACC1NKC6_9HYPO|nr:hypothetical protein NQ176_g3286 [Lecanicillium fungicola]